MSVETIAGSSEADIAGFHVVAAPPTKEIALPSITVSTTETIGKTLVEQVLKDKDHRFGKPHIRLHVDSDKVEITATVEPWSLSAARKRDNAKEVISGVLPHIKH